MSTPAERAEGIAALKAAVQEATEFLTQLEVPANADARFGNLEGRVTDLERRVQGVEKKQRGDSDG